MRLAGITALATLTATTAAACGSSSAPDSHGERTIWVRPSDLRTAVSADASEVSVRIQGETPERFRATELDGWEGNLRIVRWPEGDLVPGVFLTAEDGEFTFHFAPESVLTEGWYAVQLDLAALPSRRTPSDPALEVRDGWTSSRFRVGSYPIVRVLGIFADADLVDEALPDGTVITFESSELVPFRDTVRLADYLDVTANGLPVRCGDERYDSPPTRALGQFTVVCPRVPDGARIAMQFRERLFPDGVQVHSIRGESPPVWEVLEGEPIDGDGTPSDAIFAARESRVASEAP